MTSSPSLLPLGRAASDVPAARLAAAPTASRAEAFARVLTAHGDADIGDLDVGGHDEATPNAADAARESFQSGATRCGPEDAAVAVRPLASVIAAPGWDVAPEGAAGTTPAERSSRDADGVAAPRSDDDNDDDEPLGAEPLLDGAGAAPASTPSQPVPPPDSLRMVALPSRTVQTEDAPSATLAAAAPTEPPLHAAAEPGESGPAVTAAPRRALAAHPRLIARVYGPPRDVVAAERAEPAPPPATPTTRPTPRSSAPHDTPVVSGLGDLAVPNHAPAAETPGEARASRLARATAVTDVPLSARRADAVAALPPLEASSPSNPIATPASAAAASLSTAETMSPTPARGGGIAPSEAAVDTSEAPRATITAATALPPPSAPAPASLAPVGPVQRGKPADAPQPDDASTITPTIPVRPQHERAMSPVPARAGTVAGPARPLTPPAADANLDSGPARRQAHAPPAPDVTGPPPGTARSAYASTAERPAAAPRDVEQRPLPAEPGLAPTPAPLRAAVSELTPRPTDATPAPTPSHATQPGLPDPSTTGTPGRMRLVLGDAAERIVVDVAVRGDDVRVAFRSPDDHAAAALQRNGHVLADAMRDHGLALAQLASTVESASDAPDRRRQRREPAAAPAHGSRAPAFASALDLASTPSAQEP